MVECAFCDREATEWDSDLEMALCRQHNAEMNGKTVEIELDEVW